MESLCLFVMHFYFIRKEYDHSIKIKVLVYASMAGEIIINFLAFGVFKKALLGNNNQAIRLT